MEVYILTTSVSVSGKLHYYCTHCESPEVVTALIQKCIGKHTTRNSLGEQRFVIKGL